MKLVKHAHACVSLEKEGGRLLIDPGTFTPNAAELIASTDTVLITHEHPDHFDEDLITAALRARSGLRVYGPAAVVGRWAEYDGRAIAVAEGDKLAAGGFEVGVFNKIHALIHADILRVANVGYLVDGDVFHPGDSYDAPPVPVRTLLLPTGGPWTKVGEAADFVRAVQPERVVQIHEITLSEAGQQTVSRFLSPPMLTEVPLTIIPAGGDISL